MSSETPRVPIELDPCEVEAWMAAHEHWVLYLDDDLSPSELRDLFARYAASPCQKSGVLSEVADHPRTPPDVLEALLAPRFAHAHRNLALNPHLTPEQLRRLARSRRTDVLEHVASNSNTPLDELERLARHRSRFVREVAEDAMQRRRGG